MWVTPTSSDLRTVLHFLGMLLMGIAAAMLVPLVLALVLAEWAPALDYVIGIGVTLFFASTLMLADVRADSLNRRQALVVTALVWIVGASAAAVPLLFSQNYIHFIDALFDSMSGLATAGLTVVFDLDHMAWSHSMWRHLLHLIGGQGIVVAAISFAVARGGGAFALYQAEGREERILPNVQHTARFIWFVTAVYVTLGTVALAIAMLLDGISLGPALLNAFFICVAAFDTGGFAPHSQSLLYYHSWFVEAVSMVLMLAGTMNFALQADVWRGDVKEMITNIETRTLAINMLILTAFASVGIALFGVLDTGGEFVRKVMFHIVSAHTGTGHQTIYAPQWSLTLGSAGIAAVILAMGAGGAVSSTAGGIKALRIGAIVKAISLSIRKALSPDSAVVKSRYHHITDKTLTDQLISSSMTVFILYMVTYITGALVGMAYGYSAGDALFESTSAAGGVGLTIGITSPFMPTGMKWLYIIQMWAGRLEFLALMALVAVVIISIPRVVRKKR
ncbi:MAG: cation transporter [Actinobacteria bacterium HGW-Actinobacteria-7]|jgi:trk system potassium uptake protein TrkH|nr:MAG: cation transporter [Actinobacteria bacterium HGW-Actinobacteria-7]